MKDFNLVEFVMQELEKSFMELKEKDKAIRVIENEHLEIFLIF